MVVFMILYKSAVINMFFGRASDKYEGGGGCTSQINLVQVRFNTMFKLENQILN